MTVQKDHTALYLQDKCLEWGNWCYTGFIDCDPSHPTLLIYVLKQMTSIVTQMQSPIF